jgi:hypothetical protein
MPFYEEGEDSLSIIEKEITLIREIPIQSSNVDSLTIADLTVTKNINFPNPEIIKNNYINFSTSNNYVELQFNGTSFLKYDTSGLLYSDNIESTNTSTKFAKIVNAEINNIITPFLNVPNISADTLKVGRIEIANENDIGGVLFKNGTLSVPNDTRTGNITAKSGSIGNISFKDGSIISSNIIADTGFIRTLSCDRILCSATHITFGNVHMSDGKIKTTNVITDNVSTNTFTAIKSSFQDISTNSLTINTTQFTDDIETICISKGIHTPLNTSNNIGILNVSKKDVTVKGSIYTQNIDSSYGSFNNFKSDELKVTSNATIGNVIIQNNVLNANDIYCDKIDVKKGLIGDMWSTSVTSKDIHTEKLSVSEIETSCIRSSDYKLNDGTSILTGVFPLGIIMLFNGKIPPKGWLECNGKGGTPNIPSPAQGIIYIVRR